MQRMFDEAEGLASLGSWELDLRSLQGTWSEGLYRLHGLDPRGPRITLEVLAGLLHPADAGRMRALLRRVLADPAALAAETHSGEYRIVLADGSVRHLRLLGRVSADDDGTQPTRWSGSTQDITERVLSERELRAHSALSLALADWVTFDEGVVGLLRRLAVALEEPVAALWLMEEGRKVLYVRASWTDGSAEWPAFIADLRQVTVRPGEAAPGLAWSQQTPVIMDVTPEAVHPSARQLVLRHNTKSAVNVPAVGPEGTVAVVSFFSKEQRVYSESLTRTLSGIGQDLGRFLALRSADLHPQLLTERELQMLALAAAGESGPAIAARLVIAASTVKSHFTSIYEKLGVNDRASAVAVGLRTGLIT